MLYAHYLWGIIPLSCLLIIATANSHIHARDGKLIAVSDSQGCTVDDCLRALKDSSRSADSNTLCSAIVSQPNATVTVTATVQVMASAPTDANVSSG